MTEYAVKIILACWVCDKSYAPPTEYAVKIIPRHEYVAKIIPHQLSMR